MTLKTRRIIYIIFITIFLIAAPILLFYTAGYRFNIKKSKIQKTGAMVIDCQPKEANIFINNKLVSDKAPARVHNLVPNKYKIRIQKEGYTSWQKELEIESKKTTFAENILLFKKSQPTLEEKGLINLFYPSPNKIRIVYSIFKEKNEELWSWNLRTDEKNLLSEFDLSEKGKSNILNIDWLENNEEILLSIKEGDQIKYLLFDTNKSEESISLKQIKNLDLQNIRPDDKDSNLIYGRKNHSIYQINLFTRQAEKLIEIPAVQEEKIIDFTVKNKSVYFIKANGQKTWLEKIEIGENNSTAIANLPNWPEAKIKEDDSDLIIISNPQKQEIIIVNPDPNFPIYKEIKAKDVIWDQSYNKLLYYNDLEIWVYNIWENSPDKEELYTRYSQTINQALWYPKLGYILFSLENSVKAIEPDPRDKRNINEIAEIEKINNFILDPRGEIIYFTGIVEGEAGLYGLKIQP